MRVASSFGHKARGMGEAMLRVFRVLAVLLFGVASATTAVEAETVASSKTSLPQTLEVVAWKQAVHQHIVSKSCYPRDALARHEQGIVHFAFQLDRQGRVTSRRILRGSGFVSLDKGTLEWFSRTQTFPTPPRGWPQQRSNFTVPIRYSFSGIACNPLILLVVGCRPSAPPCTKPD